MYKRLKELRIKHKIAISEIARKLAISENLYLLYENGTKKIPLKILMVLSHEYNTSIDYIIGDTDIITPNRNK